MQGTRSAFLVVGVVLVALVAPQPAGAVTRVGMEGTVVSVAGDERVRFLLEHFADGTRNGVRVRQLSFGDPIITKTLSGDCDANPAFNDVVCTPIPTGGRITTSDFDDEVVIGGSNVGCETTAGTPFQVSLRDGDDTLRVSEACGGQTNPPGRHRLHASFVADCCGLLTDGVEGGLGNDDISGGSLDDELHGESGNDTIDAASGNDVIDGGFDHDDIFGREGDDTLVGNAGNDELRGGSDGDTLDGDIGTDLLNGGTGVDTASYATRVGANLTITLDGVANDGAAAGAENDNLIAIENVIGGAGFDHITGNGGANRLEGRGGTDTLEGSGGNDVIDSRDGVSETPDCGDGTDTLIADLSDKASRCENIQRFAVDDGPPGRVVDGSLRIRRDGRLKLRLRCPRRARVTCKGKLRLTHAGRLRTLAATRYRVRRGRAKTLRLKVSRRAARRARARRAIIVRTRERGVSKKGPRSTIKRLRVRRRP